MNRFHRTPSFQCTKCGNALEALQIMCNLQPVSHNYQEVIDRFRTAWYALIVEYRIVSTTPKFHIILDHLQDYSYLANVTLSNVTGEIYESMHQFWARKLVTSMYYVNVVSYSNKKFIVLSINC